MALMIVAGQSDLLAKVNYIHDAIKQREARYQTVKMAISSASYGNQKLVERVSGVHFATVCPLCMSSLCGNVVSAATSIQKFEWTGDEDTPQEVDRLKLRLEDLIGSDDFPSDFTFRDIHTEVLFNVHIENESHRVEISGEYQPAFAQCHDSYSSC